MYFLSHTKKVSEDLSAAGQLTSEELKQAAEEGFKSVLNLPSPNEAGFLNDEQQQAQAAGLQYANVPLKPSCPQVGKLTPNSYRRSQIIKH
ncbi:beta-lactamase hydrolase domain-containing protein [Nostoc sp.]|uniref:beta-lactamase hydrolase domain-containing protein n=1 Tax=Nostoc sp. TaxID=1180 RepID=UPI002FF51FAF